MWIAHPTSNRTRLAREDAIEVEAVGELFGTSLIEHAVIEPATSAPNWLGSAPTLSRWKLQGSTEMKDQYVGDYNDFVKYALLRALLARELPVLVCWMLTTDDRSTEGGKLAYLEKPATFRHLDPDAFDAMAELVAAGSRFVAGVEASGLLAGAGFFSRRLEDHSTSRRVFFRELWRQLPSVLFFDPDNGFEVASKPHGRRDSSKYIYWSEVDETFRLGHSVIVFQHFAREERTAHLRRLLDRLREVTGSNAFALRSANVAFLCAPQLVHEDRLQKATRDLTECWGPRLALVQAGLPSRN